VDGTYPLLIRWQVSEAREFLWTRNGVCGPQSSLASLSLIKRSKFLVCIWCRVPRLYRHLLSVKKHIFRYFVLFLFFCLYLDVGIINYIFFFLMNKRLYFIFLFKSGKGEKKELHHDKAQYWWTIQTVFPNQQEKGRTFLFYCYPIILTWHTN
jgi:hypothetical protein